MINSFKADPLCNHWVLQSKQQLPEFLTGNCISVFEIITDFKVNVNSLLYCLSRPGKTVRSADYLL